MTDEQFEKIRDRLRDAAILAEQHIRYGKPAKPSYKLEHIVLDAWNLCWPMSDTPNLDVTKP